MITRYRIFEEKVLNFPMIRQTFNYDCGIAALMGVLTYYGIEEKGDKLIKLLGPKKTKIFNNGILINSIKDIAEYFGLKCEIIRGMTVKQLKSNLDKKIPVIVLLQAWMDYRQGKTWKEDYEDGHYVVAIGYDSSRFIFGDPSTLDRTYLSTKELEDRWHAIGDNGKPDKRSVGIVITGTEPVFDLGRVIHMD